MNRTVLALGSALSAAATLALSSPAAAKTTIPPVPSSSQIVQCSKSLQGHKVLTKKNVTVCLAVVRQTFERTGCTNDAAGYLIDLGHNYLGIRGPGAREWAIRAGFKPLKVTNKTSQSVINAAIC